MAKIIVMVTESAAVAVFYQGLLEDLFGETISVKGFSVEQDTLEGLPEADLYLVCTTSSRHFGRILSMIPADKPMVVSSITFSKKQLERLRRLPGETAAMLVNLSANMAIETIAELNRLGVTNLDFVAVYPKMRELPDLSVAVTPGERRFVPPGVPTVIDIGHRVFAAETVTGIALKLKFNWFLRSETYREYLNILAEQGESLAMLWRESMRTENYLDILMGALDMGIIGVDVEGKVFGVNSIAEELVGVRRADMIGKPLAALSPVLRGELGGDAFHNQVAKLIHINDTYINLSTAPVDWQGEPVGCFIMLQRFTEEEKRQNRFRLQLYERGHQSKYVFDDIVGSCPAMVRTKKIAAKMALTDSSILLMGESGTGKELFAHSIHNASKRKDMPFVAINCAALPESLLESELFGYGEGAFTGAKKGGKPGLFEYAHKGTLFLDEIEGMSQNLQVKLLRVLQEREIMRVGDDRIITIDVRIVAASNEDILEMVHKGTFRKDLYYRLNTLPIVIPPLREREEDLFLIAERIEKKLGADFVLSPQAKEAFRRYPWDGNVRELRNILEFLRFTDKKSIELEDLPRSMHGEEETPPKEASSDGGSPAGRFLAAAGGRREAFQTVLAILGELPGGGGRLQICRLAQEQGVPLTEQEVRGILQSLNEQELASVSRGRGGSRLTKKGRALLDNLNHTV